VTRSLATVVRVAALQETVARGRVGAALAACRATEASYDDAARVLSGTALVGGPVRDLVADAQRQERRAAGVVSAQQAHQEAVAARDEALEAWRAAQQRARLLEELADRRRQAVDAARESASQRLADDLSALRGRERR
jgi:hypothetical protein